MNQLTQINNALRDLIVSRYLLPISSQELLNKALEHNFKPFLQKDLNFLRQAFSSPKLSGMNFQIIREGLTRENIT